MKIKLFLTYDYELPLGGVRSYEKGLFEPGENIINLANELNVPLVLFADICSAIKFKEWDYEGYYLPFKKQLQKAVLTGHDVQLHLHPHWMVSEYKNGTFIPSPLNMLSHFKDEIYPNNLEGIVETGIKALSEICTEVQPEYKCIAYRAGGFNLAPETNRILNALYNNGIRIDSSIPKGYYLNTTQIEIDHRFMPKKANWFISPDKGIRTEAEAGIFEVPIAVRPKNFITNIPARFAKKKYKFRNYDHTGIGHIGVQKSFWDLVLLSFSPRMLGFDNYFQSKDELISILKYNIKKYKNEKNVCLSVISHPKAMGPYHLELMRSFIETVKKDFSNEVEFSSFSELYKTLPI